MSDALSNLTGATRRKFQERLRDGGYYDGPIDGRATSRLKEAMAALTAAARSR
jgi:hypothetical protein